jgi:NTE family protein
VALVLQGGGALGAYQAGVYEALAEAGIHPDWIAGISIGAINAAIIAGNPPKSRVARRPAARVLDTCDIGWTMALALSCTP